MGDTLCKSKPIAWKRKPGKAGDSHKWCVSRSYIHIFVWQNLTTQRRRRKKTSKNQGGPWKPLREGREKAEREIRSSKGKQASKEEKKLAKKKI